MTHFKKIFCFILIVIIFSSFLSCKRQEKFYPLGYSVLPYVSLYDYKSISVDSDFVEVTDADIKMVIETDLYSHDIYKEITHRDHIEYGDIICCDISYDNAELNRTDYYYFTDFNEFSEDITNKLIGMKKGETLSFTTDEFIRAEMHIKGIYTYACADDEDAVLTLYSCNSMEEVNKIVKEKIKHTIISHYAIDTILENSFIKRIPQRADEFVQNQLITTPSANDEIQSETEALYNIYFEYMIFAAIAEKENIAFSNDDFNQTATLIAQSNGTSASEVLSSCEYEYIAYETIYEDVKNTITRYVTINETHSSLVDKTN